MGDGYHLHPHGRTLVAEAVRMANTPGVTLQQLGEELGVNPNMLGKWRKQLQASGKWEVFPGKGHPRDEEMVALKPTIEMIPYAIGSFSR